MKKLVCFICFVAIVSTSYSQVGINTTTPDASAELDIESTNKGVLISRLTTAERDAITSPANSLLIYNEDINKYQYNSNTPASPIWITILSGNTVRESVKYSSLDDVTDINYAPPTPLPIPIFGTLEWNDNTSIYTLNDDETITINETGRYLISVNCYLSSSIERVAPYIFIALDGTQIGSIASTGYIRNLDFHNHSSLHLNEVINVTAGQTIQIKASANYEKVLDTLDVWFDSGVTHFSVVDAREEYNGHSADLYLEGSDQHRGWFQSSLISSIAMKGEAPYKQVLTHGFVVDGQGRKMSKSIGNVVAPKDVTNKLGADILRLWVASTDYTGEVAVSDEILKRSADAYRRIRNTARFFLANLNGFNPETDLVPADEMVALDRWAVGRALAAQEEIVKAYGEYNTHAVTQRLMQFCSIEMGSFYLDVIKDRQYTAKRGGHAQRSCQTALYYIVEALVRWMAPIMSFTADEIWNEMPGQRDKFVFTGEWFDGLFGLAEGEELNNDFWTEIQSVRSGVNKLLEAARSEKTIGGALQAEVTLFAEDALAAKINKLEDELRFVLLTSAAVVKPLSEKTEQAQATDVDGLFVEVKATESEKCDRCWHHTPDVGTIAGHEKICGRCVSNVDGEGEERKYA